LSEATRDVHLARTVCALGIAQIISWGSLFYTIAVLGGAMRREVGVSDIFLFGSFTAGLLLSGIVSPYVGRQIDHHGGRRVLAAGSLLGVAASLVLAAAASPLTLLAGWLLAGAAMAACLYDPAFATLHRIAGPSYRRAVTALTLFGGFASTVFWPLSQFLLDAFGWRQAFVVYAALHLFVCLPLHLVFIPRSNAVGARSAGIDPEPASRSVGGAAFLWLALALALAAFLSSAIAAHLIDLLTATGLSARDAVLVGALIGPMQVAGRIMEFRFGRRLRALAVGTLAFVLMVVALALFARVNGVWIVALAFAVVYGWANGVMTIVRGTVPAELFGQRDYGALLGRLALPQFLLKAIAPAALTLILVVDPARSATPFVLLLIALAALLAYRLALAAAARR
jgi:predicted MFS family arabinose efflux permease